MLIDKEQSLLVVIDMQERLLPAIHDRQNLLDNCVWLLKVARQLNVPIVASEHYPQGLGALVDPLKELIPAGSISSKTYFSCAAERLFADTAQRQLILLGVEAHVCILQSALQWLEKGKEVYVVADCIGSRYPSDRELALQRLLQAGVYLVSREMVAFEWLRCAGTVLFRDINQRFLRPRGIPTTPIA